MKWFEELIAAVVDGIKKQVIDAVKCGEEHATYKRHVGDATIEVYTDVDDNVIVELNKPNRNDCDNVVDAIADAVPSWESMADGVTPPPPDWFDEHVLHSMMWLFSI